MNSAKHWVHGAVALAAIGFAGVAPAAVTYGWATSGNTTTGGTSYDVPTDGYDLVGGGTTDAISSGAVAGASFIIPTFKSVSYDYVITSALLTIYLADDNDGTNRDEWAAITAWSKSGTSVISNFTALSNDTTPDPLTGVLRSVVHNSSSDSPSFSGTYEVDGHACSSGWVTNSSCRTSAYDSYAFDVKSLLKEGESFEFAVARANADKTEDFWYKGAYLTLTVAKVPEPATLGLLGLGLIGIGLTRRRRKA